MSGSADVYNGEQFPLATIGTVALMNITGGLSSDILQFYAIGLKPDQIGLAPGLLLVAFPLQYFCIPLARCQEKKRTIQLGYALRFLHSSRQVDHGAIWPLSVTTQVSRFPNDVPKERKPGKVHL
jgi:hypothetical protein